MRFIACFAVILAILFMVSCSGGQSSPTTPQYPADNLAQYFDETVACELQSDNNYTTPLFAGSIVPDGSGGFRIVEDREAAIDLNITSLVLNTGSLNIEIVNVVGNLIEVNLTITNPTSEAVFDVWMIFNNFGGNKVVNPTSYTTLFSTKINPYIAFAQEDPFCMFPIGPGASDTRTMFLEYNGGPLGFIITCSIPLYCEQPHKISNMNMIGQLNDEDGGWATLSCVVYDHGWNLEFIVADLRAFTGQIKYMVSNPEKPDNFEVFFHNDLLVVGGRSYLTWVAAKSYGSTLLAYNNIEIPVEGGLDPPVVTITIPATDPFETGERFTTVAGNITNFEGTEAILDINGDQQTIPVVNNNFSEQAVLNVGDNLVKVLAEGPGGIGSDSVNINCTAHSANLWLRLAWDKDNVDVDFYITEPAPSNYTCWYGGKVSPNSGAQLDLDDVDGWGPEHYYISTAEGHTLFRGTYQVDVHYYSDHGTGWVPMATVLAYKDDHYYGEWSHIMSVSNPTQAGPANRRTGKNSWWDAVADIDL